MRKLRYDLILAFQYLKGAERKDRNGLFTAACRDRSRGNGFKLSVDLDELHRRNASL